MLLVLSFASQPKLFWGAKVMLKSELKIKDIQTDDNIAKLLDDTDVVSIHSGVFTGLCLRLCSARGHVQLQN